MSWVSQPTIDAMREMRANGSNVLQICEAFGVGRTAVRRHTNTVTPNEGVVLPVKRSHKKAMFTARQMEIAMAVLEATE